jgi:small subunit ribosomal protein S7
MSQDTTEAPKLFGEWSFEGINVRDIGLERYLNLEPIYLPHTGGRHEARKFRKCAPGAAEATRYA